MLRVFFSAHGERVFGALPSEIQQRIVDALSALARDPLWYRRVKKLGGTESRYRFRVGRWRVLFALVGGEIEIADIFLKKEHGDYRRRMRR